VGVWKRRTIETAELHSLGLTPEEGFVLSRLDVPLSAPEVVAMTGIEMERTEHILRRLAEKGAVDAPDEAAAPAISTTPVDEPPPLGADEPALDAFPLDETPDEGAVAEEEEPTSEKEPEADPRAAAVQEANYRKTYEAEFRHMARDQRIAAASKEAGTSLLALCFDPEPHVVRALIQNPRFALPHARLIAQHHRTAPGLDSLTQKAEVFKDAQVQRMLLRNPQTSEVLAKRILMPKRMMDSYKASIDTDIPDRTRLNARNVLRGKFGVSQGEERAGLIAATEGRVLLALVGLTLDARATSILCARSYTSVLFIQNLARFAACPPPLLAHLLRQPLVKRQPHLRNMILQHPNLPSEVKRKA
jgi:hypothetical protein